jgi:hypothetical protein
MQQSKEPAAFTKGYLKGSLDFFESSGYIYIYQNPFLAYLKWEVIYQNWFFECVFFLRSIVYIIVF